MADFTETLSCNSKRYCQSCNEWCSYATDLGFCQLSACINRTFASNRTLTEQELKDMERKCNNG